MKMRMFQLLLSVVIIAMAAWEHNWLAASAWFVVLIAEIQLMFMEMQL